MIDHHTNLYGNDPRNAPKKIWLKQTEDDWSPNASTQRLNLDLAKVSAMDCKVWKNGEIEVFNIQSHPQQRTGCEDDLSTQAPARDQRKKNKTFVYICLNTAPGKN